MLFYSSKAASTLPQAACFGAWSGKIEWHMLNCNLSLDCTEIATNLWRVKELTTGGEEEQKCNTAAAQRMPRCFQNNYSGFVLMGQLLKYAKQIGNAQIREL